MKHVLSGLFGAAVALLSGAAMAQSNSLMGPSVIQKMSRDDMTALLQREGLNVQMRTTADGSVFLEANLPNMNAFYIQPRQCDDMATQTGCILMEVFTVFDAGPLNMATINQFHLSTSVASTVALNPQGAAVVYNKIWLEGGVTDANVLFNVASVLMDSDSLVSGMSSVLAAYPDLMDTPSAPVPMAIAAAVNSIQESGDLINVNAETGRTRFLAGTLSDYIGHTD
ncbi:hypothetical protein [Parvularcula sp. LCG005]|uniref:hypothetical protein n=1 Tax=Parvularcula sp. LCG005 TaxID=3078805 RepID=UPI00294257AD|nr:hypothetical protein [Parvularcula sp. LCG005]WOI54072.1 hypothetical protein RUI03_03490 [Parvularcula sp. LCG005]